MIINKDGTYVCTILLENDLYLLTVNLNLLLINDGQGCGI